MGGGDGKRTSRLLRGPVSDECVSFGRFTENNINMGELTVPILRGFVGDYNSSDTPLDGYEQQELTGS